MVDHSVFLLTSSLAVSPFSDVLQLDHLLESAFFPLIPLFYFEFPTLLVSLILMNGILLIFKSDE